METVAMAQVDALGDFFVAAFWIPGRFAKLLLQALIVILRCDDWPARRSVRFDDMTMNLTISRLLGHVTSIRTEEKDRFAIAFSLFLARYFFVPVKMALW